MNAVNLLKEIPFKNIDYKALFNQQMEELKKLGFEPEILKSFDDKKDGLLKMMAVGVHSNDNKDCIPFIPIVPVNMVSFVQQLNQIAEPFGSVGVTGENFQRFFSHVEKAIDISNAKPKIYFLLNVNFKDYPERTDGCEDIKVSEKKLGLEILNHNETLSVIHFAKRIFEIYKVIMAPGLSWDNSECPYYKLKNNDEFFLSWIGTYMKPEDKTGFAVCQVRF
ncbi:MAG: hypothetical protein WDK96_03935 [Candidatus Paceibacterota bacterium]|jgi:hypothetical protein